MSEPLARLAQRLRTPEALVLAGFGAVLAVGCSWGLPGSDSWAADSISPRSCGLGAVVETYLPGHFHVYPPLQMALLTVLSLPWMALAAARVGTGVDALGAELIKPLYMTAIEATSRIVTAAMALAIVWSTMRLWTRLAGRRAGVAAGVLAACDGTFVYYAHTGNLDVPYLFWVVLAVVEIDRVLAGEARERSLLVFAALAVLTKDHAAGALLLPLPVAIALSVVRTPADARGARIRRFAVGAAWATAVFALASGALVNPSGYARRLAFLFGPASQTWAQYPPGLRGAIALAGDATRAIPHLGSWPMAVVALAGVVTALVAPRSGDRVRLAMPLLAAVSFALFFDLGARRSEERFLVPQSVLLFPYGALVLERALAAWPRNLVAAACLACLAPALLDVASVDATLLADPRYAAERFLAGLARGTHVEVYGGPIFLPRVPPQVIAVRPGVEPLADRQAIAGIEDIVDPAMDPRPRAPEVIVLSTELSHESVTEPPVRPHPVALMSYHDAASHRMLRGLHDGSLGYRRSAVFRCELPWPLECRPLHSSTAGEVWAYTRGAKM